MDNDQKFAPKTDNPRFVEVPLLEHDPLEQLIRTGPEDAFRQNTDHYEVDPSLASIIKRGVDDPFQQNADSYEVDPSLAALIRSGGDQVGVGVEEETYDDYDEYDEEEGYDDLYTDEFDDDEYDEEYDEYDEEYDDEDDGYEAYDNSGYGQRSSY